MKLNQPYYIEKREDSFSLDGEWTFAWADEECENIKSLDFKYNATLPSSVYHTLWKSGILPHPYYGTNSKDYHWVDEKVWYYQKEFIVDKENLYKDAYLSFDGIGYYSKIWINDILIGDHEGMFGGPCIKVNDYLDYGEINNLVVEVKSANYGKKDTFEFWNHKGENREIIPWNLIRDEATSNGDFVVMGIWNHIRIDFLDKVHISRPCIRTEKIKGNKAYVSFEAEISDGIFEEIRKSKEREFNCDGYMRTFDTGLTGYVRDKSFEIAIDISHKGESIYTSTEKVSFLDFENQGMNTEYRDLQFYTKDIVIDNPRLWYPNGMGEANLYDVQVTLKCDGEICDRHNLSFGIRTFEATYTKGMRYRTRWNKFLYKINGKEFFLKGMNWTPIDYLFDISPERYEWCIKLVKNAGIQLLRVWNGGGMIESDLFYFLCDKYGIMVWQDLMIANTPTTKNFPQDVLESQISYNLYRIRNHPSFVIVCGGNEFNPYTEENASSMFVTQKTVDNLVSDRVYYHTTADGGSAHIYIDMEPVWYRHFYKQLPFLAESGIHSFPNYKTLKKYVGDEVQKNLPPLSSEDFGEKCPGLINHFSEYSPERVPRMTARISQIVDINNSSLEEICEASQVQVYEFYQLMIQSMQENYPICGGVMPWVFKRPWPTMGIQTVDGDDRPCYGYYAVKNSYNPINVCYCQEWSVLAPNEEIGLKVKVFNQNDEDLSQCVIKLTIHHPDLSVYKEYISSYTECVDFGRIQLPGDFTNSCFLISADLWNNDRCIARSVYFNKCTDALEDRKEYEMRRKSPAQNMVFENGPYLKDVLTNAKCAIISAKIADINQEELTCKVVLINTSDICAYPVTLDVSDDDTKVFLSDNFFMLKSFEQKEVICHFDKGMPKEIVVSLWNGNDINLKL